MSRIKYVDLGNIVKQIGFDGVDLTIRPGGHVEPRLSSVDLVRAMESITGAGVDIPVVTTALVSPFDPTALPVIALSGRSGIGLFISGFWRAPNPTLLQNVASLAAGGMQYQIGLALHNYSDENAGEAEWSLPPLLAKLDPKWTGAYFDPIHSAANWEAGLRPLLPRLRVAALKDFKTTKVDGHLKVVPCPLGEGELDVARYLGVLAQAGFSGPLSVRLEYAPKDEVSAIAKDYAFARKKLNEAYARTGSGSGAGSGSGPG